MHSKCTVWRATCTHVAHSYSTGSHQFILLTVVYKSQWYKLWGCCICSVQTSNASFAQIIRGLRCANLLLHNIFWEISIVLEASQDKLPFLLGNHLAAATSLQETFLTLTHFPCKLATAPEEVKDTLDFIISFCQQKQKSKYS